MTNLLGYIVILGLAAQAVIGLAFMISSIWEKEERASIFGGIQFLAGQRIFCIRIRPFHPNRFFYHRYSRCLFLCAADTAESACSGRHHRFDGR